LAISTSPAPAHRVAAAASPAALAAQALAAVSARATTPPAAAPAITTPADALLPTRIGDLVRIAAQRQAEAVETQRHGAGGLDGALAARALDELRTSGTLDDALARVGAAARAASGARPVGAGRAPQVAAGGPAAAGPASAGSAGSTRAPATSATPGTPGTPDAAGPSPTDGNLPPIEVWRRPGVEIYRRQPDGRMTPEN
jgi:hypothetical protein